MARLGAGQGLGVESKAVSDTGLWLPYPPTSSPTSPAALLRANVLVGVGLTGSRQEQG